MMDFPDLVLNLKAEYFDEIKSGKKEFEYREQKPYWIKRLFIKGSNCPKHFSKVVIRNGYPKAGDPERELIRPWLGFEYKNIKHPIFGNEMKTVFAIRVNPERSQQ